MLKPPTLTSDQAGLALGAPGAPRQHVRLGAELLGEGAGFARPGGRRPWHRRLRRTLHRLFDGPIAVVNGN